MKFKNQFINELDGKGKVFSALLGVLTLFAVLGRIAPGWYSQIPEYAQLVCGVTTWSAYNKQADMRIVQSSMIALPVLFLFFGLIYVWWNRIVRKKTQETGIAFAVSYVVVLYMYYMQNTNAAAYMGLWLLLFIAYVYLTKSDKTEMFGKIIQASLIAGVSMSSLVLTANCFISRTGEVWKEYSGVLTCLTIVIFLVLVFVKQCRERHRVVLYLQFLLPFAWLGLFHFRYRYEKDDSLMELFYSGKWKWFCVLMCVVFLAVLLFEKRKTNHSIYFSTFVMTAIIRVFSQPDAIVNIDYFHNGEITMPMQQLVSYGKMPYRDIIPIHGLCDYFYGLINYLFFDGTYLALNAAKIVGAVMMALLLAAVIYFFVSDQLQGILFVYFFMPFMVCDAGMRYLFLMVMFLVLLSGRIQKGMQSLYAWVLLSIMAIAWNASIGGAAALAFLPLVLYRMKRDLPGEVRDIIYNRNRRKRNLILGAWGFLFIVGVAFIPLFWQIVIYLKENTGTTLYVNGMEMLSDVSEVWSYLVPGMLNEQGSFFITTFAVLIPLLICFILMFRKESCGAGEFFVTYLLGFWVLANYSYVRFDEGMRAKVLGVFFLVFTAITLIFRMLQKSRKDNGIIALYTSMIGVALLLSGVSPLIWADTLILEKDVPEYIQTTIMGQEIEDPVVYVSGELVEIPSLGNGFIQGNTLVSLQNVRTVVDSAKQNEMTVFDITNAVANAVIFDMPMYLPYSSAYNISNEVMQDKAISLLSERLPDLIIAAPEIRFDDAPFSFRSMKLYAYLMEQDYVAYKYENVIYLVRGENPLPEAVENTEAFAQLMHKKDLAYLPAVWGSNKENISEPLYEIDVNVSLREAENGYQIVFKEPVSGKDISMMSISGLKIKEDQEADSAERIDMTMTMQSSIASEGEAEFTFALKGDEYLIPVGCSPYFTQEESIECLELTSDMMNEIDVENIRIQFYY